MRVILIYPPISFMERYSSVIGNAGGKQIPLGIFYLASYIRKHGCDVCVIDAESQGLTSYDIVTMAKQYQPDVVGISATTVAFHRALETAKEIKTNFPSIPIVLGGSHATGSYQDCMKHEEFDYTVIGEGEITFHELLDVIRLNREPVNVSGIAFRKNGTIKVTPPRQYISDLDSLPFPSYDLIRNFSVYNPPPSNYQKIPVANIITSRGCPNSCTFCGHSAFGKKLRQRSAHNIAEEIELLVKGYGIQEIAFVDDTFTIHPERIFELFSILDKKGIRFPWTCMSRINTVDKEILRFMKMKGCWHISFGIESGNKEILKRIQKRISLDNARQVIAWCQQLHIKTKGFFIVGHPGESVRTIEESIQTALNMPLDDIVVTLNTPLPATQQYKELNQYGRLTETDWSKFNMWNPVFVPHGLSEEILIKKHKEFYRRFYLRPSIIIRYLLSFISLAGFRRALSLARTLPFLVKQR